MCMDFLRSCYSQLVSYRKDDPSQQFIGQWYFCDPRALPFPGPHAFGSPTWDTEHPTETTLGWDATSFRFYYNGRRLNTSDGTKFAGPQDYFVNGQPDVPGLERGVNGTPVECLKRPLGKAIGGLGLTGKGCFNKPWSLLQPMTLHVTFGDPCSLLEAKGIMRYTTNIPPILTPAMSKGWIYADVVDGLQRYIALACQDFVNTWRTLVGIVGYFVSVTDVVYTGQKDLVAVHGPLSPFPPTAGCPNTSPFRNTTMTVNLKSPGSRPGIT